MFVFSLVHLNLYVDTTSESLSTENPSETIFLSNDIYEGYTLFTPEYRRQTFLINNDKEIVKMWESNYAQSLGVYLLDNGDLLRTCAKKINPQFPAGGFTGAIERFNWNGSLLWQYEYSDVNVCLHHDIEPLPNGNILMIAWEKKTAEECIQAGINPDNFDEDELWPDHIIEVEQTGFNTGSIVWEWHAWDHLVQDFDPSKDNYGSVRDHPELIDINYNWNEYLGTSKDMLHINSIDYNQELDQILLSVHNFNEIWVIDHSTNTEQAADHTGGRYGMGGDILYRWGNPQTYNAGDSQDQILYGQHDATWISSNSEKNNILLFNNGLNRPGDDYSSIVEIIPPMDQQGFYSLDANEPFGPEEPLWEYTAETKTDFFSQRLSSSQRLPNGNTLICEGEKGYFFEINSENQIVWEYTNTISKTNNQITNDVFHIHRYPLNYSGIGPLESYTPNIPDKPEGPTLITSSKTYNYTTQTTDPNNDKLYYKVDWGDGIISNWMGPYYSGEQISFSHQWKNNGTFQIKIKAKDAKNLNTEWSKPLNVTVEGFQVILFGLIDGYVTLDNEISCWADRLLLVMIKPVEIQRFPNGVHLMLDEQYKGFLTTRFIAGVFSIKKLT